jgi:hypothetical protein
MTNEERIAEWFEQNEYCPQTGTTLPCTYPDDVMGCSKCEARSLIVFLDSLGFVQKDKDQVIPPIYEENFAQGMTLPTQREQELLRQGAEWLKHGAGFVRVKSILPEGK